jgi:hypothetical protein
MERKKILGNGFVRLAEPLVDEEEASTHENDAIITIYRTVPDYVVS